MLVPIPDFQANTMVTWLWQIRQPQSSCSVESLTLWGEWTCFETELQRWLFMWKKTNEGRKMWWNNIWSFGSVPSFQMHEVEGSTVRLSILYGTKNVQKKLSAHIIAWRSSEGMHRWFDLTGRRMTSFLIYYGNLEFKEAGEETKGG